MTAIRTLPRLSPDQAGAVGDLARAAERADGVGPLSEQARLRLAPAGPGEGEGDDKGDETGAWLHVLAIDDGQGDGPDGDRIVGYAAIDDPGGAQAAAEIVVAPGARRRGVGSALLAAAREAAGPGVLVWAHGFLDPARGFAAAHRLTVRRELWRMSVPTDALDVPTDPNGVDLPDGFALTTFTDADARDWLAVNAAAFADHAEQGRMTLEDLRARIASPWFDPAGFLLVRDTRERALAAFHWTKVEDGVGEVYVVGVAPEYQGRGLGRAVTRAGLAYLRGRNAGEHAGQVPRVDLYVDGDNAPAIATYRREGFERADLDVQLGPATA